jgi:hypothetical protein
MMNHKGEDKDYNTFLNNFAKQLSNPKLNLSEIKDFARDKLGINDFFNNDLHREMTRDEIIRRILNVIDGMYDTKYNIKDLKNKNKSEITDLQKQNEEIKMMEKRDKKISDNIDKLNSMTLQELKREARDKYGLINLPTDKKFDIIRRIVNASNKFRRSEQELIDLEMDVWNEIQTMADDDNELKQLAIDYFDLNLDKDKTYSLEQLTKLIKNKVKLDLYYQRQAEQMDNRNIGSKEGSGLKTRSRIIGKKIKYGNGLGDNKTLSITKPPKFKDFGYYNINYPRLIDKNVFNILYKSGSNHHLFPPIKISNEYRDFLKELIDDCRINDEKLSKLNEPESIHFNNVLIASGLSNKFKPKSTNSDKIKEENNRFNILLGEIKAGNNNKQIIKELKSLIKKFMNDGRLNKNEAQQALNEIALSLM